MYLFRNYAYQKILLIERNILNAYLEVGVGWKLAKNLFKNKHQPASISIYWCLQKTSVYSFSYRCQQCLDIKVSKLNERTSSCSSESKYSTSSNSRIATTTNTTLKMRNICKDVVVVALAVCALIL